MKFLVSVSLCILVLASLVNIVKAYELRGRGVATIMSFPNSTDVTDLTKRGGRGTWYELTFSRRML
jgi:hypothetical protein